MTRLEFAIAMLTKLRYFETQERVDERKRNLKTKREQKLVLLNTAELLLLFTAAAHYPNTFTREDLNLLKPSEHVNTHAFKTMIRRGLIEPKKFYKVTRYTLTDKGTRLINTILP
jgi:hypothetical protein